MNTASFLTVSVSGEGNSSPLLSLMDLSIGSLPMDELRDLSIRWVLQQVLCPPAQGMIGYNILRESFNVVKYLLAELNFFEACSQS